MSTENAKESILLSPHVLKETSESSKSSVKKQYNLPPPPKLATNQVGTPTPLIEASGGPSLEDQIISSPNIPSADLDEKAAKRKKRNRKRASRKRAQKAAAVGQSGHKVASSSPDTPQDVQKTNRKSHKKGNRKSKRGAEVDPLESSPIRAGSPHSCTVPKPIEAMAVTLAALRPGLPAPNLEGTEPTPIPSELYAAISPLSEDLGQPHVNSLSLEEEQAEVEGGDQNKMEHESQIESQNQDEQDDEDKDKGSNGNGVDAILPTGALEMMQTHDDLVERPRTNPSANDRARGDTSFEHDLPLDESIASNEVTTGWEAQHDTPEGDPEPAKEVDSLTETSNDSEVSDTESKMQHKPPVSPKGQRKLSRGVAEPIDTTPQALATRKQTDDSDSDSESDSDDSDKEPLTRHFEQRFSGSKIARILTASNGDCRASSARVPAGARQEVENQYQQAVNSQLENDMLLHEESSGQSRGVLAATCSKIKFSTEGDGILRLSVQPPSRQISSLAPSSVGEDTATSMSIPPTYQMVNSALCKSDEDSGSESEESPKEMRVLSTPQRLQTQPTRPAKTPTRKTELKSPHFEQPQFEAPSRKRVPAGTVSCIPFPSILAPSFGLVQEKLAHDPFRLLIALIFLNKTKGTIALPSFYILMKRYPTPEALADAKEADIAEMIQHLGLQNSRAKTIVALANAWVSDPPQKDLRGRTLHYPFVGAGKDIKPGETLDDSDVREGALEIAHLPGCGRYAFDSWRMFCRDVLRGLAEDYDGKGAPVGFQPEWMRVLPQDKELRAFLRWRWLKEGFVWDAETGEKEVADERTMTGAREDRSVMDQEGRVLSEDALDNGVAELDANSQLNAKDSAMGLHGNQLEAPTNTNKNETIKSATEPEADKESLWSSESGSDGAAPSATQQSRPLSTMSAIRAPEENADIEKDTSDLVSESSTSSGEDPNEPERPSLVQLGEDWPSPSRRRSTDRQSWPSTTGTDDASFYTAQEDEDGMLYVPDSPQSPSSEEMQSPSVKEDFSNTEYARLNRRRRRHRSIEL